ncbi:carbohydrate ABC transporter permease [Planctomonas deserti]|uniref:carbohydrate ABC transporter permease n=1 Tax=Planctomonas deserti TaxID=2144185 RepID=UPI000D34497A|nr:carbohydrate ABC transporter permease [Planctomonas deserti]
MSAIIATPISAAPRRPEARSTQPVLPRVAWWVISVCLAVLFLYPLWVMVSQISVEDFLSFADGAGGLSVASSLGNSIFVSVLATAVTVLVSTLAGYAFSRLPFPGSKAVFFVTLITFMVPFQAIITPLYLVLRDIGLSNNLVGLSLVIATFNLPLGIFLMRNSFAAIPATLEEAALIDGSSTLGALWRIMLPVALPGVVSTALLAFFAAWNEFFATLILITDQAQYTLPVSLGILSAGTNNAVDWGLMQAGVAITVIPCIVIYLVLQKYYVAGLLSGSVK